MLFYVLTCGHKLSIWVAAIRTSFTPSSLLEMEQARLATWKKKTAEKKGITSWMRFPEGHKHKQIFPIPAQADPPL